MKVPTKLKKFFIVLILTAFSLFSYYLSNQQPTSKELKDNTKTILGVEDITKGNTQSDKSKTYDVLEIVDGDTIKVSELGTLRLVGIDTPEVVDPRKPVQCFGKEASEKAKELLKNRKVTLQFDSSQDKLDKYGRTLAYVFRDDGLFFNLEVIKEGYAHEYTYSVPYKYQKEFKEAQKKAQENKKGLWGSSCSCEKGKEISRSCTSCNQLTVTKSNWNCSTYTEKVDSNSCSNKCVKAAEVKTTSSSYTCNCSKTCTQITTCEEAQYQLNVCGCKIRDNDHDGIACDAAPLHCQS